MPNTMGPAAGTQKETVYGGPTPNGGTVYGGTVYQGPRLDGGPLTIREWPKWLALCSRRAGPKAEQFFLPLPLSQL
jgi:hypothetical protein